MVPSNKVLGTFPKSPILLKGEVLIYESNWNSEKN